VGGSALKNFSTDLKLVSVVLVLSVEGRVRVDPVDGLHVLSYQRQDLLLRLQVVFLLKKMQKIKKKIKNAKL
jgi:hypothetical protein